LNSNEGDVGAREARLSIMIGGDQVVVQALEPLFQAMGKNIRYMGGAGMFYHLSIYKALIG
jgi:3-hydroxyisobutyrate dehydrogenase